MTWRDQLEFYVRLEERAISKAYDKAAYELLNGADPRNLNHGTVLAHQRRLAFWRNVARRAAEIEAEENVL
jgi:hypothetical protein